MAADPTRRLSSMDALDAADNARPGGYRGLNDPPLPGQEYPDDPDAEGYRAPANAVEEIVVDIYARVLGIERVGVDDSFFDMGGDSLAAMRVIAAINTALDVRLTVRTLFHAASVRSLSRQLASMPRVALAPTPTT